MHRNMPVDLVLVRHGQSEGNLAQRLCRLHHQQQQQHEDQHQQHEHPHQRHVQPPVLDTLASEEAGASQSAASVWSPEFRSRHNSLYRLTDRGRRQASIAGAWIRKNVGALFDKYFTSEYVRAMETAAMLGLPSARWATEIYLRERDRGILANKTHAERHSMHPDEMQRKERDAFYWQPSGGESIANLCLRVDRVMENLAESCSGLRVIIVCHGGVIKSFRALIERLRPAEARRDCAAAAAAAAAAVSSACTYGSANSAPNAAAAATAAGTAAATAANISKVHNCQIVWYTRRDPLTGSISNKFNWVRSVCPWNLSLSRNVWRPIVRHVYSNEELLRAVSLVPQLVNRALEPFDLLPEVPQLQQHLSSLKQQQRYLKQQQHQLLLLLQQQWPPDDYDTQVSPKDPNGQQQLLQEQPQLQLQRLQQHELQQQQLQLLLRQQQRIEDQLQQHRDFRGLTESQPQHWEPNSNALDRKAMPDAGDAASQQQQYSSSSVLSPGTGTTTGVASNAVPVNTAKEDDAGMALLEESGDDSDWSDGDIVPIPMLPLRDPGAVVTPTDDPVGPIAAPSDIPAQLYEVAGAALHSPLLSPREYTEGPPVLPATREDGALDDREEYMPAAAPETAAGSSGRCTQHQVSRHKLQTQQGQEQTGVASSLSYACLAVRRSMLGYNPTQSSNWTKGAASAPAATRRHPGAGTPFAESAAISVSSAATGAAAPSPAVSKQQQNKHKVLRSMAGRCSQRAAHGLLLRQQQSQQVPQQVQQHGCSGRGRQQQRRKQQPQTQGQLMCRGTRGFRHRWLPRGYGSVGTETPVASRPRSRTRKDRSSLPALQPDVSSQQSSVPLSCGTQGQLEATALGADVLGVRDTGTSRQGSCSERSNSRGSNSGDSRTSGSRSGHGSSTLATASSGRRSPGETQGSSSTAAQADRLRAAETPENRLKRESSASPTAAAAARPAAAMPAVESHLGAPLHVLADARATRALPRVASTNAAIQGSILQSGTSSSSSSSHATCGKVTTSVFSWPSQRSQQQLVTRPDAHQAAEQHRSADTGPSKHRVSSPGQEPRPWQPQQPIVHHPSSESQPQQFHMSLGHSDPMRPERYRIPQVYTLAHGSSMPLSLGVSAEAGGDPRDAGVSEEATSTAVAAAPVPRLLHMMPPSPLQEMALPAAAAAAAAETRRKMDYFVASTVAGPSDVVGTGATVTTATTGGAMPPIIAAPRVSIQPRSVSMLLQEQQAVLVRLQQQHLLLQQALVELQPVSQASDLHVRQAGGYGREQVLHEFAPAFLNHAASVPAGDGLSVGELESLIFQGPRQLQYQTHLHATLTHQGEQARVLVPQQLFALQRLLEQHQAAHQRLRGQQEKWQHYGSSDDQEKGDMPQVVHHQTSDSGLEEGRPMGESNDTGDYDETHLLPTPPDMNPICNMPPDMNPVWNTPPLPVPLLPPSLGQ